MTCEAGDDLDCPCCDATHEVRRGRGVRVKGFTQRVPASLYVECPEAGYLPLDEEGRVETVDSGAGRRNDAGPGSDGEQDDGRTRDDWP